MPSIHANNQQVSSSPRDVDTETTGTLSPVGCIMELMSNTGYEKWCYRIHL